MTAYQVHASLSLNPPGEGKLAVALPSGTPSLILEFSHVGSITQLGAIVTTDSGEDLRSGAMNLAVTIKFWADVARDCALPGTAFALWYGGYVGKGRVDDPLHLSDGEAPPNNA